MKQKVIITDSEETINDWLENDWTIVSVTPQHVAGYAGGTSYSDNSVSGKFCFVIQKPK